MNKTQISHTKQHSLLFAIAIIWAVDPIPFSVNKTIESGLSPGASHAVGYYHPGLCRVVLIGGPGQPRAGTREQVWGWGDTGWEHFPESGPEARGNASAAYDTQRNLAIVTGGIRQSATDSATWEIIADTWEGGTYGWRRISGTEISPRDHHSMVYDERLKEIILFGGIPADRSEPWPGDTWVLRSEGWIRIAKEGPAGRARSAMVYDNKRKQVVLFGGVGEPAGTDQSQIFYNDTWIWEGAAWRKVAEGGPHGRYAHGMVFDEHAGVVLLYSGAAAHSGAPLSDMWQWDGVRWAEIQLTGPAPGHRYQPVMVYDRARARTVLYGGLQSASDDTWEWDGRHWIKITP